MASSFLLLQAFGGCGAWFFCLFRWGPSWVVLLVVAGWDLSSIVAGWVAACPLW